jgi:hypothetical protein
LQLPHAPDEQSPGKNVEILKKFELPRTLALSANAVQEAEIVQGINGQAIPVDDENAAVSDADETGVDDLAQREDFRSRPGRNSLDGLLAEKSS